MVFNAVTGRSQTQAGDNPPGGLIPEDAATEIIKEATESSAVMRRGRRLPNMSSAQRRVPVLSVLPTAYFVTGDTGHKRTTHVEWEDVFINAEEIAVIAPVPENVFDDAAFNLWDELRPPIAEAIGLAFDRAVLYGENAPASWPTDLEAQINAAGHVVAPDSVDVDLYDDLLGDNGVISLVEQDGYMVNGHLAKLRLRGQLRGLREPSGGQPIFLRTMQESSQYSLDGEPIEFPRNGSFVADDPFDLVSGDWDKLVFAVRRDITWKILDQAVITDPNNNNAVTFNLPQQDMIALRVKFRAGWALPRPASRVGGADRLPFAALGEATAADDDDTDDDDSS